MKFNWNHYALLLIEEYIITYKHIHAIKRKKHKINKQNNVIGSIIALLHFILFYLILFRFSSVRSGALLSGGC